MELQVVKFVTGPIETNTYIVSDEQKRCFIVDPSSGCNSIIKYIEENSLTLEAIALTHGHFDHALGIGEIRARFPGVDVYVNSKEAEMLQNPHLNGSDMIGEEFSFAEKTIDLKEGEMKIGSFPVRIIIVPGHSPAGTAILIDKYLICGDILFAGSIGRSDFYGGDGDALVKGIHEKIMVLPDETVVCPGHFGRSTVGREKRENPYL